MDLTTSVCLITCTVDADMWVYVSLLCMCFAVLSGGSTAAPVQATAETDMVDAATGGSEGLAASAVELLEARQKLQYVLYPLGFLLPAH